MPKTANVPPTHIKKNIYGTKPPTAGTICLLCDPGWMRTVDANKTLLDKIEACEAWFLIRVGNQLETMKNEHVVKNLTTDKTLLNTIKARKLSFFSATPKATSRL